MEAGEFRDIGERLYGHGWKSRLADILEIDSRSVRRWASGEWPIPSEIADVITALKTAKMLD